MEETTLLLLSLTKKTARMKAALQLLKAKIKNDKSKGSGRHALLNEDELNEVLEVAGMLEDDVNVIQFDNCRDIAYEEGESNDTL